MIEPTELLSFVMSRKMLRGIRDRAERGALSPSLGGEQVERKELHDVGSR